MADLNEFKIEQRLMTDPSTPVFYLYYSTVNGDILGKLMFTDYEIIFEPLNQKFKGVYSYEFGNILENFKMGFIISYEDILNQVVKVPSPIANPEKGANDFIYYIQIELKHTGNFYYCDKDTKHKIDYLASKGKSIAVLSLKVNNTNLVGEPRSKEQKNLIADLLIQTLTQKISNAKESSQKAKEEALEGKPSKPAISFTSVPFYDMCFENIFEAKENELVIDVDLIDHNLGMFRHMFGLGSLTDLAQLKNQSLMPLGSSGLSKTTCSTKSTLKGRKNKMRLEARMMIF